MQQIESGKMTERKESNSGAIVDGTSRDENALSFLVGIGLDGRDGQFRITRGEDFQIVGGSDRTHRRMQDKIMHVQEDLAKKGRTIASIQPDDFDDIGRILKEE